MQLFICTLILNPHFCSQIESFHNKNKINVFLVLPGEEELIEEVILPDENAALAPEMERCLAQKKIYWPADSQCYTLLTQGPCHSGHWLVAAKIQPRYNWQKPQIKIHCKAKKCPCLASDPDFCEVEMENSAVNCRGCVTALAAEQDGICGQGEQLFNSPFGYGICGCRTKPHLHVPWNEDGKCYPLLGKGPCSENETLHWSQRSERPICMPRICPEGLVLSALDGRCHFMHTQGNWDFDPFLDFGVKIETISFVM